MLTLRLISERSSQQTVFCGAVDNCYICDEQYYNGHMKDTSEYTKIYKLGNKALYVHKGECHYSFLLEEGDTYSEVIVSKHEMDDAFDFPAADELTWVGKFELLFGNFDGFDYFVQFCDEHGVETKTYVWD